MLNKILFQGRLTADPELKEAGGFNMLEFTIAWNEKYKDTERNAFLRCKAWRNTAEFIDKYFEKGQEILIEGQLATESWEKDGQKQSRTICNVEKVNFCGSKSSNSNNTPKTDSDGFMKIPEDADEEIPYV